MQIHSIHDFFFLLVEKGLTKFKEKGPKYQGVIQNNVQVASKYVECIYACMHACRIKTKKGTLVMS